MCLVVLFLSVIRLSNVKVAALLLCMAFVYDIFFVFISPLIFSTSVMVKVATGDGPTADPDYCEKCVRRSVRPSLRAAGRAPRDMWCRALVSPVVASSPSSVSPRRVAGRGGVDATTPATTRAAEQKRKQCVLWHGDSHLMATHSRLARPLARRYPDDSDCTTTSLPMLLLLPRVDDYTGGYTMLGLGDIVLPGLLVSFAIRYDTSIGRKVTYLVA